MKIRRSQYVTAIWNQATKAYPGHGLRPSDYGWNFNDNILRPTWFEGPTIPLSLFKTADADSMESENNNDNIIAGSDDQGSDSENPDEVDVLMESDDQPWSEDSDSDQEDIVE